MEIICMVYYMIAFLYIVLSIRRYFITPNLIFVIAQVVMFIGIESYADYNNSADKQLVLMYLVALISFIVSSAFNYRRYGLKNRMIKVADKELLTQTQQFVIWLMVGVSILACTYLFVSAGGNVFLQSIQALAGNNEYSTKVGRKNILGVTGVGYIYQFRTIILPILTVYLINTVEKNKKWLVWLIFPLMVIFILGTGQRGGFVMFLMMWVVALLLIHKYYHEDNLKKLVLLGLFFIVLFSLTTVLNGRVEKGGNVVGAMMTRIMDDNQACAVYGFRYIMKQPIQWGKDWFYQIMDILPGKNSYQALSVRIFATMNGGSTAGTAPACIWGSAYYNWGWLGVTLFPALLANLYAYIYRRFIRKESNKLRIFLYSGAFVVLGMWVADGPMILFNQGFITIILMIWIIRFSRKIVFYWKR